MGWRRWARMWLCLAATGAAAACGAHGATGGSGGDRAIPGEAGGPGYDGGVPPSASADGGDATQTSTDAASVPAATEAGSADSAASSGSAEAGAEDGSAQTSTDGGAIGDDSGGPIPVPPPPGSFATHPTNGAVTLASDADMAVFCMQYDGVIGSLTISSSTITNLDALRCLVEVTGALQINVSALTSAALPNLRAVGSLDLGGAQALATVGLPQLEFATVGDLRIYGSDALLSLALPRLAYVGQNLAITANTKLTDLSAPGLVHAGGDVSSSNSQLVHAGFAGLVEVGHDLSITSNALAQIELHAIRRVGNALGFSAGASYTNVDVSHLESVGAQLNLDGNGKNDDLVTLDLSSLSTAPFVSIEQHPQLKTILAPKLNTAAASVFASFDPALEQLALTTLVSANTVSVYTDPSLLTVDLSALTTASSLDLRTEGPADITLPSLTSVTNDIQTSGLRSLTAPALTSLGSGTFNGASAGFRLDLPLVTRVPTLTLGTGLNNLTLPLQSVDSLSIVGVTLAQIDLPALNHATNIQAGQNPNLASVQAPLVSQVTQLDLEGPQLQTVSFGSLASADKLILSQAPMLATLSLPSLTQVITSLQVDSTGLGDLSFAQVTLVGGLDVTSNPNLTSVAFPAASVYSLHVTDNTVLATLDLRSMKSATLFSLSNNGKLTALPGFGALTTVSNFYILNHTALVSLQGLHGITQVGGAFQITGNSMLPQSEVDALVAAIGRQNITGTFNVQ